MLLAPPMTAAPSQRLPQHLARRHALPLLVLLSVASCTPQGQDVDAGPKPLDPAQYAVYLTRFPFGGRTTEAWAARLNELKSGPQANADLYALTVARAQANGLVVDDGASVTVKPGPAVSAIILRRLQP